MLFVALLKVRSGTTKERIPRRVDWQPPEGLQMVAEYWLQTPDPSVICIMEANGIAPIMAASADWDDFFDITVIPAVTAEDGLELAKQMMHE